MILLAQAGSDIAGLGNAGTSIGSFENLIKEAAKASCFQPPMNSFRRTMIGLSDLFPLFVGEKFCC